MNIRNNASPHGGSPGEKLSEKQAQLHYNLGRALAKKGDLDGAIASLQKALEVSPDWSLAVQALQDLQGQRQKILEKATLQKATEHYHAGKDLLEKSDYIGAIACFRRAIEVHPVGVDAYLALANILVQVGELEEAIQIYRRVLELKVDLWEVHHKLGNLYRDLGRKEEAIAAYERSIELKSDFAWNYDKLADVLVELEEWQRAIVCYEKLVELQPDFAWGYYKLGDVCGKLEHWDGAVQAYRLAIKLDEKLPQIHEKLGDVLECQRKLASKQISEVYKKAIENDPNDLQLYYKALEVNPQDAEISLRLANVLRNQGKLEQAITFYKNTLQFASDKPQIQVDIWQNLGNVFQRLGRLSDASNAYYQAVKLEPNQVYYHFCLIRVLQQLGKFEDAVKIANQAIQIQPRLTSFYANWGVIKENIGATESVYKIGDHPKVAVCGWELAHNSVGRVYTLAQLYQGIADVEIIGSIFPQYGRELWEPIRNTSIPCHSFIVEDESLFLEQAMQLVLSHPYDMVHLSKPRMPNILFGLLYKLVWNARVIVDIDDEELGFVNAEEAIDLDEFLKCQGNLPELNNLTGQEWTQIAVGLAKEFDAVTVSNPALQSRYGGQIIRHARDERVFQPSPERRMRSREKFGIAQDKKVVLFFGTPRDHKGLLETGQALSHINRDDLLFVIVGDFPDQTLKSKLEAIQGVNYKFLGNQPFDQIPDVVAIGDICVLLNNIDNSLVSQFQVPAKLSDALALGLTIIMSESIAVADVINSEAVISLHKKNLGEILNKIFLNNHEIINLSNRAKEVFIQEFSHAKNTPRLGSVFSLVIDQSQTNYHLSDKLNYLLDSLLLNLFGQKKQNIDNSKELINKMKPYELPENSLSQLNSSLLLSRTSKKFLKNPVNTVFGNQLKVYSLSTQSIEKSIDCQCLVVTIIVYADQPGQLLRLTLESINTSVGDYEYYLYVICDWENSKDDDYNPVSGIKVKVHKSEKRQGFYQSISRIIKNSEVSNYLILRAGVVVSPEVIAKLIKVSLINGDYDIISPLTTNTPFLSIPIKQSENFLSTSKYLELLNGENSSLLSPIPSLEIFFITKNAIKLVPFPHWSLEQDKTVQSLVRYFSVLIDRGGKIGISLDSFAVNLSNKLIEDSKIESLVESKYKDIFKSNLNQYIIQATEIIKKYNDIHPVLIGKKTICFLLQDIKLGGGAIVICNLANQLLLLGFNVKVFVKHWNSNYQLGFNLLFHPQLYSSFNQILDQTPVGTIYVATLWTTARDVEKLTVHKKDSVGLYFIQDYEVNFYNPESKNDKEREYWKGALDSYFANIIKVYTSDWIKAQLLESGLIQAKQTFKVNVGIDHCLYPPRSSRLNSLNKSSSIVIGAMARPSTPRRGFPLLVSALKLIKAKHPEVEIILFGENDLNQYSIDIDFEYKLEGKIEPINLASLYRTFDIFLDTSDFQGFGLCPLEAMSAGCICVLTDSGGILEYARDGENSIIVPHNPDDIVSAVSFLLENPNKMLTISSNAIETSKKFDIFQTTKKWLELIESVNEQTINYLRPSCVVVIPVYNKISVARRCIESVIPTLRKNDELVIVDDASDNYTASELKSYEGLNFKIKVLKNEQNQGFVGAVNRGMEYAHKVGKDVILLNSDTIVVDRWIERLENSAFSGYIPAIVSPMSTESSHLYVNLNPGESFIDLDYWLRHGYKSLKPEIITPEGWCLFIPKEVYQKIGFLDHIWGRGYCEESDFCMKAYAAGFSLKSCDNLVIYHQGKVTFGKERSKLYDNNRKIFDRRWLHIYTRLYKEFIRKDPLSSLRLNYKCLETTADFEEISNKCEFDDLTSILDDVQENISLLKNLIFIQKSKLISKVKSIAVLLPSFLPYGGVLSVVSLVNNFILSGIDAKIVVLKSKNFNGDDLGCLTKPIFLENKERLIYGFPDVDLIVVTSWITVYYAGMVILNKPCISLAYYIQDYEVDFSDVSENLKLKNACLQTYQLGIPSFCKTEWIKNKVIQSGGTNVEIVMPALDIDTFYPQDTTWENDHCHVLGMYRPSTPQRDPETLIATFTLIKKLRPNAIIWIFGSDSIPEEWLKNGLIDKNLGVVSNADLPVIYSSADIFVETSIFHGFGRTIAEAMACQTACVITNSGGPTTFAKDDYNCIMRPPKDVQELAKSVVCLLDDEDTRSRLSCNGRLSVQSFSPKRSAQAIANILNISSTK